MTSNHRCSVQYHASKHRLLRGLVLMAGLLMLGGCKARPRRPLLLPRMP
jgi:uncharacterized lipoprotein YajG